MSVHELTDRLPTTHHKVSKHSGVLYQSGIVSRERAGNKVYYSIADYTACRLIEQATCGATCYVEELAGLAGLEVGALVLNVRSVLSVGSADSRERGSSPCLADREHRPPSTPKKGSSPRGRAQVSHYQLAQ